MKMKMKMKMTPRYDTGDARARDRLAGVLI